MKIFHVDRDHSKSLDKQKKELKAKYADFEYLFSDGASGNAKIHFMSTGLKDDADSLDNNK